MLMSLTNLSFSIQINKSLVVFFGVFNNCHILVKFLGGGGGRGGAYSCGIWNEGQQIIGGSPKIAQERKLKSPYPPPLYINDEPSLPSERSEKFPSAR